jgi:hypothetical protein
MTESEKNQTSPLTTQEIDLAIEKHCKAIMEAMNEAGRQAKEWERKKALESKGK